MSTRKYKRRTTLVVTLYNETISHHNAADTIYEVIKKLILKFGSEKVMEADRSPRTGKQRLISKTSLARNGIPDRRFSGYYISRDYNNEHRKRHLEDIAEHLGIPLSVKIVPK